MAQSVPRQGIALANVLLATDFSSASRAALLYALSLVRRYGATLYLAHVVRGSDSDSARAATEEAWREGQRLTTDLLISGELRGVPHALLVGHGEIWEGLAPMIQQNNIDLLVVGTRGRSGLAKMLMGSVAEQIFRQASCPVLTVGPNTAPPLSRETGLRSILYASDFTAQSVHALEYAVSLAQHYPARLILLHVLPEPAGGGSAAEKEKMLEEVRTRLGQLLPAGAEFSQPPELLAAFGAAGARILEVAAEKSPDLIVLGVTHPSGGAFAGRRWTVASEVAAKAACPVLTVRATES